MAAGKWKSVMGLEFRRGTMMRVMLAELNASGGFPPPGPTHLVWQGTNARDTWRHVGLLYCFRERDRPCSRIYEMVSASA